MVYGRLLRESLNPISRIPDRIIWAKNQKHLTDEARQALGSCLEMIRRRPETLDSSGSIGQ
jgi:hypothetical protein